MTGAVAAMLSDGRRLHLQHGPIDLIIEADGPSGAAERAYRAAWRRFPSILPALVDELPALRCDISLATHEFDGPVARRMACAVRPHAEVFVTPMAAVAGAVADEVLAAMLAAAPELRRAYVNNGGDIALHLGSGARFRIGIAGDPMVGRLIGHLDVGAADGVRGIATSGRHGRSLSLGIADSVTVAAASAAAADAAATLIANAVDLPGHPAVRRVPAEEVDPDSDLGRRLVTVEVGRLTPAEVATALARGGATARQMRAAGLIAGATLSLAGESRIVAADTLLFALPEEALAGAVAP